MTTAMELAPEIVVRPHRGRRWLRYVVLLGITVLLLMWWNWYPLLTAWGQFLDIGRPLSEPVDVVFVLGGDLESRPFVAAEIYREGYTSSILVSQPQPHSMDFLGGRTEGDLMRGVLLARDVPADVIHDLPLTVDSSRGELDALKGYVVQERPKRVAIVTSDFHTRRVRLLAGRVCAVPGTEIVYVSAPVDTCRPANWWQNEDGIGTYLLETVKLITVYLRAS